MTVDMRAAIARQLELFDLRVTQMFLTHVTAYREVPYVLMVGSGDPNDPTKLATIDREFVKERDARDHYPDHAAEWARLTNRLDPARALVAFMVYQFGDEGQCASVTVCGRDDETSAMFDEKREQIRKFLAAKESRRA